MGYLSLLPHLLIYSIIYLCQYRLMSIYFILWVIIQYYFILLLKLFQPWPLRALSGGSCDPLTYTHQFFEHFLNYVPMRCSRLILYISCPNPRISRFSKEHRFFFFLDNSIRNQDPDTKCACCYCGVVCFTFFQLIEQKNVCILTCIYTHT